MTTVNKVSRILGWAFLFQAMTSLIAGAVLESRWFVDGNISATMTNIANHTGLMRANILVDMFTALGIIFLGALLFIYLRKYNEKMALVGFGFYILEAVLIAASRMNAFSLLRLSQEWVATGQPADLLSFGNIAYESSHFTGMTLVMLAFCFGAIPLYYLLYKSKIIPRILSLWGLITVFPCLIGTLLSLFGYDVPIAVFLPYAPFEFVVAFWILIKGVKADAEIRELAYAKVKS